MSNFSYYCNVLIQKLSAADASKLHINVGKEYDILISIPFIVLSNMIVEITKFGKLIIIILYTVD